MWILAGYMWNDMICHQPQIRRDQAIPHSFHYCEIQNSQLESKTVWNKTFPWKNVKIKKYKNLYVNRQKSMHLRQFAYNFFLQLHTSKPFSGAILLWHFLWICCIAIIRKSNLIPTQPNIACSKSKVESWR